MTNKSAKVFCSENCKHLEVWSSISICKKFGMTHLKIDSKSGMSIPYDECRKDAQVLILVVDQK
mgnify:CR=1 FL=1|jgi:hypothetical protein